MGILASGLVFLTFPLMAELPCFLESKIQDPDPRYRGNGNNVASKSHSRYISVQHRDQKSV